MIKPFPELTDKGKRYYARKIEKALAQSRKEVISDSLLLN